MANKTKTIHIYKLFNSISDKFYIGSTCNAIRKRVSQHKTEFKKWINNDKKGKYYSSYAIYEEDVKNVKWVKLHTEEITYESNIERDRKKRGIEAKFIKKLKKECGDRCVNKNVPFEGGYKQYQKEWRQSHKKEIKEYQKEYQKKDKCKQYQKQFQKKYYRANREVIKQKCEIKIKCPHCNSIVRKSNISYHKKTKKCMKAQGITI